MEKFILMSFAVWRFSSLLAQEEGPGKIFRKLRMWIATKATRSESLFWEGMSEGIHCVWCNSIWVAVIGASVLESTNAFWWFVNVLALSTMAIIINNLVMKGD